MSKSILAFGLGIVVGAGGMWFFNKPQVVDISIDGATESYSVPMNNDSNTAPATGTDENTVPPTGSNAAPLNLSDASNMNNTMDNANNTMDNANNTMDNTQNNANEAGQNAADNMQDTNPRMDNMPNQGQGVPNQGQGQGQGY